MQTGLAMTAESRMGPAARRRVRPWLPTVASGVLWLAAAGVQAQLGLSEADCKSRWGEPVSAADAAGGRRTLVFSNATVHVEVGLSEGVVERCVYHDLGSGVQAVPDVLAANAGGAVWTRWSPPQAAGQTDPRQRWMRSDERAMAAFEGGAMSVIGAGWHPACQGAEAPGSDAAAAAGPASPERDPPAAVESEAPAAVAIAVKVPRPDEVPNAGDSRASVVQLLGRPTGTMRTGNREILSYPWGWVCLRDGKVTGIE